MFDIMWGGWFLKIWEFGVYEGFKMVLIIVDFLSIFWVMYKL